MKGLIITGLILLGLGFILFYLLRDFSFDQLFDFNFLIGIFFGLGIGQLIGGLVGYISKGSAIKEAQMKKQLAQLQREKEELEKQAILNSNSSTHQNPSI